MAMFTRIARSLARVATVAAVAAVAATAGAAVPAAAADSAESIYSRALGRERELRDDISGATLTQLRAVVRRYETVVQRFPRSGYCDNALWQGGNLALLVFERYDKGKIARLRSACSSCCVTAIRRARSGGAPPSSCRSSTRVPRPLPSRPRLRLMQPPPRCRASSLFRRRPFRKAPTCRPLLRRLRALSQPSRRSNGCRCPRGFV